MFNRYHDGWKKADGTSRLTVKDCNYSGCPVTNAPPTRTTPTTPTHHITALPQPQQHQALLTLIQTNAAAILGHTTPDTIDPTRGFLDMGFDSLTAVELRNRLSAAIGLRLPATLLFDHPTPNVLATHLGSRLSPAPARRPVPASAVVSDRAEPIAIIGMGCRYPGGVRSPEQLWHLLDTATDAIDEFPTNRGWNLEAIYHPDPDHPGTAYVRHGGFLHDADQFDADFFGISPREATAMDPQQRLLLETTWETIEHANINPATLHGTRTGVFTGAMSTGYGPRLHQATEDTRGYLLTGLSPSVAAGRVAYTLGLHGPALTIDTACSSSLVAVHLAAQALHNGECDLALAGGATVMATPVAFLEFSRQRGLSPDGRCRSFAATANGTGWSEGAGQLLLERLSDARRNGHHVLALIRGSAVNSDGASNGLTAPNGPSQERVIHAALTNAGLTPDQIDAVEAHGTGTTLGDPIEAQALLATYGQAHPTNHPLRLGSIKSNIGHTQAAAGTASIIKMVMAMRHGILPKTLHADNPTPHVDWTTGNIALLTKAHPWPSTPDHPRRAGVSGFGASGTNVHLILEEAPSAGSTPRPAPLVVGQEAVGGRDVVDDRAGAGGAAIAVRAADETAPVLPLLLSAKTEPALRAQATQLHDHLHHHPDTDLPTIAHALATTRTHFPHRAVITATDRSHAQTALAHLAANTPHPNLTTGHVTTGKTVFVFPGQGSQWAGMATELLATSPTFAHHIHTCAQALAPHTTWNLLDVLTHPTPDHNRVDIIQPTLFAVMTSLARLWQTLGIHPDAVIGHSQGEIAAAHIAGALTLTDAATLITHRAATLTTLAGTGTMAAIPLPHHTVQTDLQPHPDTHIAAINGPATTIISGPTTTIHTIITNYQHHNINAKQIPVDYPSHCPHITPLHHHLTTNHPTITPTIPTIPIYSPTTATKLNPTTPLTTAHWYDNLRNPVQFQPTIQALIRDGHTLYIETSPHPILTTSIQDTIDHHLHHNHEDNDTNERRHFTVTGTLRRNDGGWPRLLTSLATTHTHGAPTTWTPLIPTTTQNPPTTDPTTTENPATTGPATTGPVSLPTYPFQHRSYWLNTAATTGDVGAVGASPTQHPLLGAAVELPDGGVLFTGSLALHTHPWLAEHGVSGTVLLPATAFVELALRAAEHVGCALVDELTLEAPLWLPEHGSAHLRLSVSGTEEDGRRSLTLHSRPAQAGDGQPWVMHARGKLADSEATLAVPAFPTWPPADAVPVDISTLYQDFAKSGYEYGPIFQGLTAAWRLGDHLYTEASLPPEYRSDCAGYGVHPALLDAALHGTFLLGDQNLRLPFVWSGLRLHATGATTLRTRITPIGPDTYSIVLADASGQPVATVESLAMRQLPADQLGRADGGQGSLYRLAWAPVPAPHDARPDPQRLAMLGADDPTIPAAAVSAGGTARVERYPDLGALRTTIAAGTVPDAVLAILAAAPDAAAATAALASTHRGLALVQGWLDVAESAPTRLVLITRGAVAAAPGEDVPDLVNAPIWGLVRSAQSEYPGRFVLIDIDDRAASLSTLRSAVASGQPQLAIRDGNWYAPRVARVESVPVASATAIRPDGTVLVTGATGTIGRHIARHLVVRHGARHLLLVSRSGGAAAGANTLKLELSDLGAEVTIAACDVADRDATALLLASVPAEHPLTAVVHAAGVLDDGALTALTPQRVDLVMRPKVSAAVHLHELTSDLTLEQFIVFSGFAGIIGNGGQAHYAAANVFLDALAAHRRARGLPGLSLAWGFWAERSEMTGGLDEVGLRRLASSGVAAMSAEAGLALFDAALDGHDPLLVPIAFDLAALRARADAGELPPVLHGLVRARRLAQADTDPSDRPRTLLDRLAGLGPVEQERTLTALVCEHAATVLRHPTPDDLNDRTRFRDLGFDSLTAVELRNRLNLATGLRLPATIVFDHPSPWSLAQHLRTRLVTESMPNGQQLPTDADLARWEAAIAATPPDEATRLRLGTRLRAIAERLAGPGGIQPPVSSDIADRIDSASDDELFNLIDDHH